MLHKTVDQFLQVSLVQSGALVIGNAIAKLLDNCVSILGHIGSKIDLLRVYNKCMYLNALVGDQ